MTQHIGIIEYGSCGNTKSLEHALEVLGYTYVYIKSPECLTKVNNIILPGVGTYYDVMSKLDQYNLTRALQNLDKKKKVLGICIGMHIMSRIGYECKKTKGLNLIGGDVRKMIVDEPIPHMGFSEIKQVAKSPIFSGISEKDKFYFMHSFEYISFTHAVSTAKYGEYEFISSVSKRNFFGVQFHPEKSRDCGLKLLKNFCEL